MFTAAHYHYSVLFTLFALFSCNNNNKVNQKSFLTKNLKSVGMTLAKVKEQDGMTLAKVKEQDWMTLAKVRHAQVSHAPH